MLADVPVTGMQRTPAREIQAAEQASAARGRRVRGGQYRARCRGPTEVSPFRVGGELIVPSKTSTAR